MLLKEFLDFCQYGAHYLGALLDIHVYNMRLLYRAVIEELHEGFQCFWSRRPAAYNLAVTTDQLFPQSGFFYGTMRRCMMDIEKGNELARFRAIPSTPTPFNRKRQCALDRSAQNHSAANSSTVQVGPPPALGGQSTAHPSVPAELPPVGSWSWSVKEDPNFIHIFEYKYAKALILEKLNLNEAEICLPAYLSRKGAAACTHAGQTGHEVRARPYMSSRQFRSRSGPLLMRNLIPR